MIDIDTVQETEEGTRLDRLTALLIGLIAIVAACLVLVQTVYGLAGSRAGAQATRSAVETATRAHAGNVYLGFGAGSLQEALKLSVEGTSRQIVGLQAGDDSEQARGMADQTAGGRLFNIACQMGADPQVGGPVDPYVRDLVIDSLNRGYLASVEHLRQVASGNDAGDRSGNAVLGLSFAALAGVLVGLSAVLGEGRGGRLMLLMAYLGLAAAVVALLAALALPQKAFVPPPFPQSGAGPTLADICNSGSP